MKQILHAIPDKLYEFAADSVTQQRLSRVLRLRVGAEIVVADGTGLRLRARWTGRGFDPVAEPERAVPLGPEITLGVGVVKGERWDWLIEKCTEAGVDRIVPLHLDHGVVRIAAADVARRLQRWQATAVAAFEQCGRATLPAIAPPQDLAPWLAGADRAHVFVCDETHGVQPLLDALAGPRSAVTLLVGPEGGLSAEERHSLAGAQFVGLGPAVLRAETAAVVAVALVRAFASRVCVAT